MQFFLDTQFNFRCNTDVPDLYTYMIVSGHSIFPRVLAFPFLFLWENAFKFQWSVIPGRGGRRKGARGLGWGGERCYFHVLIYCVGNWPRRLVTLQRLPKDGSKTQNQVTPPLEVKTIQTRKTHGFWREDWQERWLERRAGNKPFGVIFCSA